MLDRYLTAAITIIPELDRRVSYHIYRDFRVFASAKYRERPTNAGLAAAADRRLVVAHGVGRNRAGVGRTLVY